MHGAGGGVCAPISLGEGSPTFTCKKDKPIKVSPEECLKIQKETKTAYIFNRIETDSNGQISAYITTV